MDKDKEKTKVIFRYWKGEVIAIFPTELGDNSPHTCSSYQHVGQHSACDPYGIVAESRPAIRAEFHELYRELENLGYNLEVIQRNRHDFYIHRQKALANY